MDTKQNSVAAFIWYTHLGARCKAAITLRTNGSLWEFESTVWAYLAGLKSRTFAEATKDKGRPWRYTFKSHTIPSLVKGELVPIKQEADWMQMMYQMLCPGSYNLILTQVDRKTGRRALNTRRQPQKATQNGIESVFDDKNETAHLRSGDQTGLGELANRPDDKGPTNMGNEEPFTGQPQATDVAATKGLAAEPRLPTVAEAAGIATSLAHYSDSADGLGLEVLVGAAKDTAPTPEEDATMSQRDNRNCRAQNVQMRIAENARRERRAGIRPNEDKDQCQASDGDTTLLVRGKAAKRPNANPRRTSNQTLREYKDALKRKGGRTLKGGKGYGAVKAPASLPKVSNAASSNPLLEHTGVKKTRKDNRRITGKETSGGKKRKPVKGRRGLDN
ncbi:MAG: hypothetical protein Q9186_004518 [Xanthomendoza sp. 1 TL-2023]